MREASLGRVSRRAAYIEAYLGWIAGLPRHRKPGPGSLSSGLMWVNCDCGSAGYSCKCKEVEEPFGYPDCGGRASSRILWENEDVQEYSGSYSDGAISQAGG